MASASVSNPSTLAVPVNKTAHAFDKGQLDAMLSRRFFYAPAFEIYGGKLTSCTRVVSQSTFADPAQVSPVCTTLALPALVFSPTLSTHGASISSSKKTCSSSTRPS